MALNNNHQAVLNQLLARKQYDRAIELLIRLLKSSPDNLPLKHKLADAYFLYGRTSRAVTILSEIGEAYAGRGFVRKANAVLTKIERMDPDASAELRRRIRREESSKSEAAPVEAAGREEPAEEAGKAIRQVLRAMLPDLADEELGDIAGRLVRQQVARGEVIYEEGSAGDCMLIISSGSLLVSMLHKNFELELAVLEKGKFIGEVSLLTDAPRTATVAARENCELYLLSRKDFLALDQRYPQIRSVMMEAQERRAEATIESLVSFEQEARGDSD